MVEVVTPLRIDIGGTWDLKSLACLCDGKAPSTVNIALDLPIRMSLSKNKPGRIAIRDCYGELETDLDDCDFRSPFGLLLAICWYMHYSGFSIEIEYSVPPRSGLGGSGSLAAGFILGMKRLYGDPNTRYRGIAQIVHEVEESLRFSFCGMQDQLAALYGGVNQWIWCYKQDYKFARKEILTAAHWGEISRRLIVAYLGRPHAIDINQRQVDSFFNPATRGQWFEINELTHTAAQAMESGDWDALASCISQENEMRLSLIPERLATEAVPLMEAAARAGAGFGIAGAGAGGCVFALCPDPGNAKPLGDEWSRLLAHVGESVIIRQPAVSRGIEVRQSADGWVRRQP